MNGRAQTVWLRPSLDHDGTGFPSTPCECINLSRTLEGILQAQHSYVQRSVTNTTGVHLHVAYKAMACRMMTDLLI